MVQHKISNLVKPSLGVILQCIKQFSQLQHKLTALNSTKAFDITPLHVALGVKLQFFT